MLPLHSNEAWPSIAVYDIEAENWIDVTTLAHVDESGNRKIFRGIPEYLDWLFSDEFDGTHVWAHYGGGYDHRFILREIVSARMNQGWTSDVALSAGKIVSMTVRDPDEREIQFVDSWRILPAPLASIAKTVGLQKGDIDRDDISKYSQDDIDAYCLNDCDIVVSGLQRMRDVSMSVGADYGLTLPSIAARYIRRSITPRVHWDRLVYRDKLGVHQLRDSVKKRWINCEPAYFGGRVEAFKLGTFQGPLYYYDIRSSYPTSMMCPLPLYLGQERQRGSIERCGISIAEVIIPESEQYPSLPVRKKLGSVERLIFPTGHFAGVWTHAELLYARKRGAVVNVMSSWLFDDRAWLTDFVDTFYGLRKATKDPFESFAYKILLNSGYGKLNETRERRSLVIGKVDKKRAASKGQTLRFSGIAGVYYTEEECAGKLWHVPAAAYVTALSRIALLRGIHAIEKEGGRVYYCDTDSIISDVPLPSHMLGHDLGDWEHEHTFDEVEILGPKIYRAVTDDGREIYRCKGVPIERGDELSRERWNAYRDGIETALLEIEGLNGLLSDLQKQEIGPTVRRLVRTRRGADEKRVHDGLGSSVPIHLGTQ